MNNIEILIIYTLIDFFIALAAYKFFGKKGLIIFIIISAIAANIQVSKGVSYDIFGHDFSATMGNVMFGGIFLANDLINEKYGKKEARSAVYISIFAAISFAVLMYISTLTTSMDDAFYQNANNSLNFFFSINGGALKAIIIGNCVYLISQLFDVLIYSKFKSINSDMKWLWLRNSASTFISQIVDTTLITYLFAIFGIVPLEYAFQIVISTLVIKYIITAINSPLFYLIAWIKPISTKAWYIPSSLFDFVTRLDLFFSLSVALPIAIATSTLSNISKSLLPSPKA